MPPPDTTDARVFLCHASEQAVPAQELCVALEARGQACWIAPRDIRGGEAYAGAITRAIRDARAMLVLLSRAANESQFVLREVDVGASRGTPMIAVRLEEVSPTDELGFYLGKDQWIDALHPPMEAHADRILRAIGATQPSRLPAPPASLDASPPPKERLLKDLSRGAKDFLDVTLRLKASLEEKTAVLVKNGAATRTLTDAALAFNQVAPRFVDRLPWFRAAVRKYWGVRWLDEFDALHELIEAGVYRGGVYRLNPIRARLNDLLGTGGGSDAERAAVDREKAPLLDDLQARLDDLERTARGLLSRLERDS